MFKGVLFDMDGVLFDTERQHIRFETQVAAEMGYELTPEISYAMFGTNSATCQSIMMDAMGSSFDYAYFRTEAKNRAFAEMEKEGIPIKKGVPAVLEYFSKNKYQIAVASSSVLETVRHHIKLAKIDHYFDAIVAGDMVQVSKPDPAIFIKAAKSIGVSPEECIAIEDSYNGVRSAAYAKCFTIMVPDLLPPNEEMKNLYSACLPSLEEVPAFLNTLI